MPFNFPDSPSLNQVYAYSGQAWKWNGEAWDKWGASVVSVRDYGATGDGTTNDAAAIQAAIDALELTGGTLYFPAGRYLINSTVTIDLTGHTSETDGKGIQVRGEGSNSTVIINGSNSTGIQVQATVANNSLYSYFRMTGLTLTKTGVGTSDIALFIDECYGVTLEDVVFISNSMGLQFTDCVLMSLITCHFRFNTRGVLAEGAILESDANAINFFGCIMYGQAEYCVWIEGGCNVNFYGGSIETTVGGVQPQRFGVRLNECGNFGNAICAFYGVYFERNGNTADVWISNGDTSCTYLFSACTFNRLLNTDFSTNNILLATNGNTSTRVHLVVEACGFARRGSYVADASRRYIAVTGATPVEFRSVGNFYQDKVERPEQPANDVLARVRFTGAAGAITREQNVSQVVRNSTGNYTITFRESNTNLASGRTINITTDIGGFNWVTAETTTTCTIQCTNAAGVNTDPGSCSVVVYE